MVDDLEVDSEFDSSALPWQFGYRILIRLASNKSCSFVACPRPVETVGKWESLGSRCFWHWESSRRSVWMMMVIMRENGGSDKREDETRSAKLWAPNQWLGMDGAQWTETRNVDFQHHLISFSSRLAAAPEEQSLCTVLQTIALQNKTPPPINQENCL